MWIYTPTGFISIVYRDNKGTEADVLVRSRDRASIQPLADFAQAEIVLGEGVDYAYRAVVSRRDLKAWLAVQVDEIDYPNFKDRAYKVRGGSYVHALSQTWTASLQIEDEEAVEHFAANDHKYFA